MTKDKRELIDEGSNLSSARWALVTCIQWGIGLAFLAIVAYIVCSFIGKPLPNEFLGGCTVLISLIIGIPTVGKTTQSYSELKNHYFDKYDNKFKIKTTETENKNEDGGK